MQFAAYFHIVYLAFLNKYKWIYINVWGERISRLHLMQWIPLWNLQATWKKVIGWKQICISYNIHYLSCISCTVSMRNHISHPLSFCQQSTPFTTNAVVNVCWEKLHYNDSWCLLWHLSSLLQRGKITHYWNSHQWYSCLSSLEMS